MESNHHIWRGWAVILHKWGIHEVVASFLESSGPLSLIAAQLVYMGQPLLNGISSSGSSRALAELLEDEVNRHAFIRILREEARA
jgi:hypothetical protein